MLHPPGTILFHFYEVLANIGQGGMGAVFKARDLRTDEVVAIKQMRPDSPSGFMPADLKDRFEKEWTALHALDHPRIPRMLASFSQGDSGYYVMEFIEGQSLDQVLEDYRRRGERFPEQLMLEYALQILEVLVYLHGLPRPMLHRDIKPQNIIVRTGMKDLVLVDFGLIRATGASASTKTMVGTLGYCPLEQVKGHPEPRSDLYAVGATMFHMLAGEPPAPFDIPPLQKVRPDVHPGVAEIVNRAVRSHPQQRYSSALKMEMAVRQLLAHLTGQGDDRLAQLYMEDEPHITVHSTSGRAPMPTWVFFGSLFAGVALVLFVLMGVAHIRSVWSKGLPTAARPMAFNMLPAEQPTPPPADPGGAKNPPPPTQPIALQPATREQQQIAAGIFPEPFRLIGVLGTLTPDGTLQADLNRPAGLWLQSQRPFTPTQIRLQVLREQGPANLQIQLESPSQHTVLALACQPEAGQRRYIHGIALMRRGQANINGNGIIGPESQFDWLTLRFTPTGVRLELDGLEGSSEVPEPMPDFQIVKVLLPADPERAQSVRLQHVSLIGQ